MPVLASDVVAGARSQMLALQLDDDAADDAGTDLGDTSPARLLSFRLHDVREVVARRKRSPDGAKRNPGPSR